MDTLVVNGEPVVYGRAWAPVELRRFLNQATGESDHCPGEGSTHGQIQALVHQSYEEENRTARPKMNVTERNFQFVADECCAEHPRAEKFGDEYTVLVKRKSRWGESYTGQRRIRGCRCRNCGDDPGFCNSRQFMRKVSGVKFEI